MLHGVSYVGEFERDGIVTMSQEIQSDSELAGRVDILDKWLGKFPQQR